MPAFGYAPAILTMAVLTMAVLTMTGKTAFGYAPAELEGKSILGILHPADHKPFVQTAHALLATSLAAGGETPPQSVRVLHRVFFRQPEVKYPLYLLWLYLLWRHLLWLYLLWPYLLTGGVPSLLLRPHLRGVMEAAARCVQPLTLSYVMGNPTCLCLTSEVVVDSIVTAKRTGADFGFVLCGRARPVWPASPSASYNWPRLEAALHLDLT